MTSRQDYVPSARITQRIIEDARKLQVKLEEYKISVSEQFRRLNSYCEADSGKNLLVDVVKKTVNEFINESKQSEELIIRQPKNGEYGWIVQVHGKMNWKEYKYDVRHEGLVATIISEFIETFKLGKQLAWIAELDGEPVGIILCSRLNDDTAKLRLLMVDPKARGLKIGEKLVETLVNFAESVGYKNIVLWTTDLHTAAIRIYEKFGFLLVNTEVINSFGRDALVSQDWKREIKTEIPHCKSDNLQLVESNESDLDKLKYEFAEYRIRVNEKLDQILQLCDSNDTGADLATSIKIWSRWFTTNKDEHCEVIIRQPKNSEYGWIIRAHGKMYWDEYRWNVEFEGLVSKIVGEFIEQFEEGKTQAWIAELNGEPVGCVFCAKEDETTAKLRVLLVQKGARGLKLGEKLVDTCISFAKEAGYQKLTLWTSDVQLVAARKIYERAGFYMVKSYMHQGFGHDHITEMWNKDLK